MWIQAPDKTQRIGIWETFLLRFFCTNPTLHNARCAERDFLFGGLQVGPARSGLVQLEQTHGTAGRQANGRATEPLLVEHRGQSSHSKHFRVSVDTTFVSWRQELTNVKPPVCSKATSTSWRPERHLVLENQSEQTDPGTFFGELQRSSLDITPKPSMGWPTPTHAS